MSKLYYRAWCAAEAAIYQQVFGNLVMTIDGVERRAATWPEWAFTTRLDATAHWQQVQRAVDCHRSQLPAYQHFAALSAEEQRILWGSQSFYRALSLVNGGREVETDLFVGLANDGAEKLWTHRRQHDTFFDAIPTHAGRTAGAISSPPLVTIVTV